VSGDESKRSKQAQAERIIQTIIVRHSPIRRRQLAAEGAALSALRLLCCRRAVPSAVDAQRRAARDG
jgi:hypothetical protein